MRSMIGKPRATMGKFIPVDPDRWAELVKAAGERDALVVEVRRLDAEVERLTKAGDLMCRMAGNNQVINRHWKTAKKGDPTR